MSEPTIIAVIILFGVFLIMIVAIIKEGTEKAKEMWTVMGALTGVAFGAIISYYFTEQNYQGKIQNLRAEITETKNALTIAARKANSLESSIKPVTMMLTGDKLSENTDPITISVANALSSLEDTQRAAVVQRLQMYSTELQDIEQLKQVKNPKEK